MIEASQLSYAYGPCPIFSDLSFHINVGEIVAILGPNGAGKTTLMKVLCGDLLPTSGQVVFAGKPLRKWEPRKLAQRRAVLPQSSTLDFAFNVEEVVLMGRTPHLQGSERPMDMQICRDALQRVDMLNYWGRLYTTLSGGERQRIHLARVLAQLWKIPAEMPSCLFLDEPTSNLDLSHQHSTLKVASEFVAEGHTSVIVMHDLNLALRHAHRVIVLHQGKIHAQGLTAEVLTPDLIENVFGVKAHYVRIPGQNVDSVVTTSL